MFMLRVMNMWMRRFKNLSKSEYGSHKKIVVKWKQCQPMPAGMLF